MNSLLGIILFMTLSGLMDWDMKNERKNPARKMPDGSGYFFSRPRVFTWLAAGCGALACWILVASGDAAAYVFLVIGVLSLLYGKRRYFLTDKHIATRSAIGLGQYINWDDVETVTYSGFKNLVFHSKDGRKLKIPTYNPGISTLWQFMQTKLIKSSYENILHPYKNASGPFQPPTE